MNVVDVASWMSVAMDNHSCSAAVGSSSSLSKSCCHHFCKKILAFIVTGDKTPMGSKPHVVLFAWSLVCDRLE